MKVARWEGFLVKKVKELSTNQQLQGNHGDVKCSLGNTVNNVKLSYQRGTRFVGITKEVEFAANNTGLHDSRRLNFISRCMI